MTPRKIRNALKKADCHYKRAAEILGVTPRTMRNHMRRLEGLGYTFPEPAGVGGKAECYEPTPAEIEAAAAEIRKGWTTSAWRRGAGVDNEGVQIKQVTLAPSDGQREHFDAEW